VKEPIAFHLLTSLALLYGLARTCRKLLQPAAAWLQAHFVQFTFLLVIAVYWVLAITSHLNIGVRHMMPVLPFTYVLVADGVISFGNRLRQAGGQGSESCVCGSADLAGSQRDPGPSIIPFIFQ
jgi:hypothetical protein